MESITLSDFTFVPAGFGAYHITYQSPKTGKKWTKYVTDMQIVDLTKNANPPLKSNLIRLKRICKSE
jgi:hypothetical protein